MKKRLVRRTMAGFLAVWLVFSAVLATVLIRYTRQGIYEEMRHSAEVFCQNFQDAPSVEAQGAVIGWLCRESPYWEAAAIYRNGWLKYETRYKSSVMLEDSERQEAYFSLIDLFEGTREDVFQEIIGTLRRDAVRTGYSPGDEEWEHLDTFVSGWVRGDRLYPYRLVLARYTSGAVLADGHSWDVDDMQILYDWRTDPEAVYKTNPGWLGSGRKIENVIMWNDAAVTSSRCRTHAEFAEMMQLAADQAFLERAQQSAGQGETIADSVVILRDGLPYGRYYLYFENESWGYAIAARGDPVRETLPVLALISAVCLLFTLAAGGLVCRAMCRVYDRQAALEQSRRDTTNALAHDLKTPLALIHGYAENLELGVRPEKHPRYLAQIQQETGRMDRILGGMLDLSRLETGSLPLHQETVDLHALIEECAERWQPAAEVRKVTVSAEGSGTVKADRELFARALDNLVSNALRHTPEGGSIRITAKETGLSVENTGAPIPPDELPRLFEAYYTGDRARSGGRQHGLGLAIVKAVAEQHGMTVWAENTECGVCFTITF